MKRKLNLRKIVLYGTLTTAAMGFGDKVNIGRSFTSLSDTVRGIETAGSFARYADISIITNVNEENKREVFLVYDRHDGDFKRITEIQNNGYAIPRKLGDRLEDFVEEGKEQLENIGAYDRIDEFTDKLGIAFKHYSNKTREFFENLFK